MARAPVDQVQCDRCKRVYLTPRYEGEGEKPADFEARLADKTLKYPDLCDACKSALKTAWNEFLPWNRQLEQPFLGSQQAPPLSVAPDYSPPKPHAANKK